MRRNALNDPVGDLYMQLRRTATAHALQKCTLSGQRGLKAEEASTPRHQFPKGPYLLPRAIAFAMSSTETILSVFFMLSNLRVV
jgi:hypothetical protein